MKSLLVLILLFCCSATFGQQSKKEELIKYDPELFNVKTKTIGSKEDVEFLEKDLGVSQDDIVSLGRSERAFRKLKHDLRPLPKIDKSKIKNPFPPYHALIKRGTTLYSLDLTEAFLVKRDIIAKTNEIVKGGNISFVFAKSGEEKFIVVSKYVEKIEEHLQLESKIDARKEWKRDYRYKVQDYVFQLEHNLNFHIENIHAVFFAEITDSTSTGGRANRVEYKAFFPWEFPIEFGISTSFQDGRYNNFEGGGGLDWNAVFAGPHLRTTLISGETYKVRAQFGIEKSLYFDVAESFQMSTNLWAGYIEAEKQIRGELFTFSIGYRDMQGHIKKSIIGDIEKNSTRREISSVDFAIGYRFNQFL